MPEPRYPIFKPVEISDKVLFEGSFKRMAPEVSELTFTNIYSWRDKYKLSFSILDSFIILKSGEHEKERFFEPIGAEDKRSAVIKVLESSAGYFMRVSERTKCLFGKEGRIKAEEDIDNSDYLYRTEDLVKLTGKKYDGKRNLIKRFRSSNRYEYIPFSQANISECLDFEERWCIVKDCDHVEGLNSERYALKEMVRNFSDFRLSGGMIKINGAISAVGITEPLNPDTLVMHILKADPSFQGLYQTMMNELLAHEGTGYEYVNMEQDLGIEGLRKAKLSYHPIRMVKKYTLKLV